MKDRTFLTNALSLTPEVSRAQCRGGWPLRHADQPLTTLEQYLKTKHGDTGAVIDYRSWNLSLGRRFRCDRARARCVDSAPDH